MSERLRDSPLEAGSRFPRALDRLYGRLTSQPRWLLLGYGLAWALAGMLILGTSIRRGDVYMQGLRLEELREEFAAMHHGVWPLTSLDPINHHYYDAAPADDKGLFLLIPTLGWIVGSTDPLLLLKWVYITLFAALLATYPLVFGQLFRSRLAAIAAPIIAFFTFRFIGVIDAYWFLWWTVAFCLPIVLVARHRWSRRTMIVLAGAVVVASAGSMMRSNAGLPILVAAIAVVLSNESRWRRRLVGVLAVLVCYLTVLYGVLHIALLYRDQRYGNRVVHLHVAARNLWHIIYMGLGWQENPYGIRFLDQSADNYVASVDPHVQLLTSRYEAIVRKRVLHILETNPGFVLKTEGRKAIVLLHAGLDRYPLLVIVLPAMALVGSRRRRMRGVLVLTLPALLLTAVPPILAIPQGGNYDLGWIGTVALVWVLSLCWLTASLPELVGSTRRTIVTVRSPQLKVAPWQGWPTRRIAATGCICVSSFAALLVIARADRAIDRDSFYLAAQPQLSPQLLRGAVTEHWRFSGRLPTGWQVESGASVRPLAGGTEIHTGNQSAAYQLVSPRVVIPPGSYVAVLRGGVRAGGMEIGALNDIANSWIALEYFSNRLTSGADDVLGNRFAVTRTIPVRIVLSNWVPNDSSSEWLIRSIELLRAPSQPRSSSSTQSSLSVNLQSLEEIRVPSIHHVVPLPPVAPAG